LSEKELVSKALGQLDYSSIENSQKLLDQLCALKSDGPVPDLIALLNA